MLGISRKYPKDKSREINVERCEISEGTFCEKSELERLRYYNLERLPKPYGIEEELKSFNARLSGLQVQQTKEASIGSYGNQETAITKVEARHMASGLIALYAIRIDTREICPDGRKTALEFHQGRALICQTQGFNKGSRKHSEGDDPSTEHAE